MRRLTIRIGLVIATSFPLAVLAGGYIVTGISDIHNFLDQCPTNDPAYNQIRQDFELRIDGQIDTVPIVCREPIANLPIDEYTDELIALQTLRTAYYMGIGTEGKLPWTSVILYDWMKSHIAGVDLKTAPGLSYCCDSINGKLYFSYSRQDAFNRGFKRDWKGIAITLDFYAHEIHHADPGAPGHTTGCQAFPLPTDPPGCDATYDLSNLGSYGVQYWLESNWATGYLNIGIGCAPPATAFDYATWNAAVANDFRSRFVTNIPPIIDVTQPYGGPCISRPQAVPPVALCQNVTVAAGSNCTAPASINNGSYAPDGESVTLAQSPAGPYPLGNTPVTLTVSDANGGSSQCTGMVDVIDKTPPSITGGSASPSTLWPPNHKMVDVTVNYNATDNCGQPACQISSVSCNESITNLDYSIVDARHVELSAERLGSGTGRIYVMTVTCTDTSGNSSSQFVTVTVPHDNGTAAAATVGTYNGTLEVDPSKPAPTTPFLAGVVEAPAPRPEQRGGCGLGGGGASLVALAAVAGALRRRRTK